MSKANDRMLTETRRRPMRSLVIALGVGALAGAVLDRLSRRSKHEETAPAAGSMPAQSSMPSQEQAAPQGSMT
jgi:hypothetical protein